ncbi:MAG: aminotransferase class III-fold pyridoxal phosphate-dependent enzyme, partial [Acidimicrobiales bacterium]
LGNGVPIGACWATDEVAAVMRPGDHATTFGGQPLAAAAARATLAVMEEENAAHRAAIAGAELTRRLQELPEVESVRGLGLLLGVQLSGGKVAADVAAHALAGGLVVNPVSPTALRLAPSLLLSEDELEEGVDRLAKALAA